MIYLLVLLPIAYVPFLGLYDFPAYAAYTTLWDLCVTVLYCSLS